MIYHILSDGNTLHHSAWQEPGRMFTEAKLSQEINKAGSIQFTLPPQHKENVSLMKSTVEVMEDSLPVFSGRPVSITSDFFGYKKIVCEGNLNYLKDIPDLFSSPAEISRIYKIGDDATPLRLTLTESSTAGTYHASISANWIKKLTSSENGVSCFVCINTDTYEVPVEIQSVYSGAVVQRKPWIGSYKFKDKNYSDPKNGGSSVPFYIDNSDFYLSGESGGKSMTIELSVYKRKALTYQKMFSLLFGEDGYNSLADNNRKLYAGACDIPGSSIYDPEFGGSCLDTLHSWQETAGGYIYTSYEQSTGHWLINYTRASGKTENELIEFGVNLLDVNNSADVNGIISAILPVGKDSDTDEKVSLTGTGITKQTGYPIKNGIITDSQALNRFGLIVVCREYEIEHNDNKTVMLQSLYDIAVADLQTSIDSYCETVTVSALDPRFIKVGGTAATVGNKYRILSAPHGINLTYLLSKKEADLISPENSKLFFGITKKLLTEKVSGKD